MEITDKEFAEYLGGLRHDFYSGLRTNRRNLAANTEAGWAAFAMNTDMLLALQDGHVLPDELAGEVFKQLASLVLYEVTLRQFEAEDREKEDQE